jgi:PAS domain S-box-containing protein
MNDAARAGEQYAEELMSLRRRLEELEASESATRITAVELQHALEELQVAEEELRQQNEELTATHLLVEQERSRYAMLFDLVPGAYVVTDAAGIILEINHTAAALFNRPSAILLGKPLLVFVAQADRQAFSTQLSRLKSQEWLQDWEIQLQPWRGQLLPAGITVAVKQYPPEQEPRLYWLIQDLTSRKQAEAERQRLEREAKRAEHFVLLGKLAAGLSHEIRNPLGAIALNVDLLDEELAQPLPDSTAHVAQSFAEIKTNLARLDDLLQDYLSLVRVAVPTREPVDLGTVVTTLMQEIAGDLEGRAISLHLDGLTTLGSVMMHQSTLRRALLNLVQNAMDAMPQGGELALCGRRHATHVQLEIHDSGSGISAANLRRIFEPLYTTKPGGTGLGLYIVQEIVTAHDGQVTVQSREGEGTTFTVVLPVNVENAA